MPVEITSRQNTAVKALRALARGRDNDRVLLDGAHLIEEALDAGAPLEFALASHAFAGPHARLLSRLERHTQLYLAHDDVLDAASPVRTPGGIVAIATLAAAPLTRAFGQGEADNSAFRASMAVALVDVQDPGNAGAVVRAVEAAGGTGVIACGSTADLRGWKSLRASMGSAFRVPIAHASIDDLFEQANDAGVRVIASTLDETSADMRDIRWHEPFVLLVGNEGHGLVDDVRRRAEVRVRIPMYGRVQSLNAAVSAAVILFEAQRQRDAV